MNELEEKEIESALDDSFEFEMWLSTDGKHTVNVKAKTDGGRAAAVAYATARYEEVQKTYGKKGVTQTNDFAKTLSADYCTVHDCEMLTATSKKTGKPYSYHKSDDGNICFGRGWKESTR